MKILCKMGAHSWAEQRVAGAASPKLPTEPVGAHTTPPAFTCACRRCSQQRVFQAGSWSITGA